MGKRYEATAYVGLKSCDFRWPLYICGGARTLSHFMLAQRLMDKANKRLATSPRDALTFIDWALDYFPDNPQFINVRSLILIRLRDFEGALKEIDRAIKLAPDFFALYISQGNLRFMTGDSQGGGLSFRQAGLLADEDEERALVFFQFGIWLTVCEDYDSAKRLFKLASELDPGNEKYAFLARVNQVSQEQLEKEKRQIVPVR